MSSAVRIEGSFHEKFQRIYNLARNPRSFLAVIGREVANNLKVWFRHKDKTEPNQLGGERQHFWLGIARSVQQPVVNEGDNAVEVTISDPRFAQKLFGGPIRAKRTKFLAIPQTAEAYGRRPRVFEQETGKKLFFLGDDTQGELVESKPTSSGELIMHYLLKPSVNQAPDADALPDLSENGPLLSAVMSRAESHVRRQLNGETAT